MLKTQGGTSLLTSAVISTPRLSGARSAIRSTAKLSGRATELSPKQDDVWWLPPQRTVKGLGGVPDIPDQDAATSKSRHILYSLDKLLANASTSHSLGDDEFAQIRSESKVVGACESRDRGVVYPHQRQVARSLDPFYQGRVGPMILPKAGLRFHQPANGRKILARACRITPAVRLCTDNSADKPRREAASASCAC